MAWSLHRRRSAFRAVLVLFLGVLTAQDLALPAAWARQNGQPGSSPADQAGQQPRRQDGEGGRRGRGQRGPGGAGGLIGALGGGMGGIMGGGMRELMQPPVSTRDIDRMTDVLTLTDDQKVAADELVKGYQQQHEDAAKQMRERMEAIRDEFRESGDPSIWREAGTFFDEFRSKRKTMEQALLNDVKSLLTPEQEERWPVYERTRRRETTMRMGVLAGERVDVVRLVEELELPESVEKDLQPVLEQYQLDLDRELQARNAAYEQLQVRGRELFTGGDEDEMQRLIEQGRETGNKLRELNRRIARQVEASLPEDRRVAFSEAVRRESYPLIYRPTYARRVIDAAMAFEDLDDNQRASMTAIADNYSRELAGINKQLEALSEQREQAITAQELLRRGLGALDSEESQGLRRKRRELDGATVDKVKSLLSTEQANKLPERGDDRDEGRGEGGNRQRRRDGSL